MVEIVKEHDLLLLEDDPYGDLIFSGERMPSLFTLGGPRNFIYMSSFSKTIAPGMRIAYICGNEELISKLAVVKQGTDLQTNTFGQYVVNEYLESGQFDRHKSLLRQTYKSQDGLHARRSGAIFPCFSVMELSQGRDVPVGQTPSPLQRERFTVEMPRKKCRLCPRTGVFP